MTTQKTLLITGASKGIGKAISLKMLKEGHRVIGLARHFPASFQHANFEKVEMDLSQAQELPVALKNLHKTYPTIDALICNAGQGLFKHLEEFSFEQMRRMIDLNIFSHLCLVKTFLPSLKKRPLSDIIFIGSEASLAGKRQGTLYCASKFAIRGFAQALREECATSPVRVCLINPGMVQTTFFDELSFAPGSEESEHLLPEDIAEAVSLVIQARAGTVYDEINVAPHKKKIIFKKGKICMEK